MTDTAERKEICKMIGHQLPKTPERVPEPESKVCEFCGTRVERTSRASFPKQSAVVF